MASGAKNIILATFNLSSANALYLVQSKNLSNGKELTKHIAEILTTQAGIRAFERRNPPLLS